MLKKAYFLITGIVALTASLGVQAATLEQVKKRGAVACGHNVGLAGFADKNKQGLWEGLDVDICRAVAAAVFGDATKVEHKPLTATERFDALRLGRVDILTSNTTWTHSRDTNLGLNFVGVNYYDGQGVMVSKSLNVSSVLELDGTTICSIAGTTTEQNLADYFRSYGIAYKPMSFETTSAMRKAFAEKKCQAVTADQSQLYVLRSDLKEPNNAVVLPEVLSKEPLGPAVREGDDVWFNIVRWSLMTMVEAEFLGVTSNNAKELREFGLPEQKRLLGADGETVAQKLGVPADWSYHIITQVGNYAESFDRNLGAGSKLKIARGLNAQWNNGGLLYSSPIR